MDGNEIELYHAEFISLSKIVVFILGGKDNLRLLSNMYPLSGEGMEIALDCHVSGSVPVARYYAPLNLD